MKTFKRIPSALLIGLLIATSASATTTGNNKKASTAGTCLEISGRVSDLDKSNNNEFRIYLFKGANVCDSTEVGDNSTFRFLLKKDEQYSIKIAGTGFVSKLISISTELPEGVDASPAFRFHFDTELISESQASDLNSDALDFPIALISFDKTKGWFDYRKKYTENIKKQIVTGN